MAVIREEHEETIILAKLGVGTAFGELSLLHGSPRTATMTCLSATTCAILEKDDYNNLLANAEKKKLEDKVDFLA